MAGETVYTEQLELMLPGKVNLGVPTLRDILLVHARATDGSTRIIVEKTESDLKIVREDERPIQIHVRLSTLIDREPWFNSKTVRVFEEPTPLIRAARHESHPYTWVMDDAMPPCETEAAAEFLSTVGFCAYLIKQPSSES